MNKDIINIPKWIVIIVIIEQLIKKVVVYYFADLIVKNYNSIFGLVESKIAGYLLLFIAILVLSIIIKNTDLSQKLSKISIILICSGAVSNLIDRIIYGYVIDYLNFINISHYNLADVLIIIGAILYLWQSLKSDKPI